MAVQSPEAVVFLRRWRRWDRTSRVSVLRLWGGVCCGRGPQPGLGSGHGGQPWEGLQRTGPHGSAGGRLFKRECEETTHTDPGKKHLFAPVLYFSEALCFKCCSVCLYIYIFGGVIDCPHTVKRATFLDQSQSFEFINVFLSCIFYINKQRGSNISVAHFRHKTSHGVKRKKSRSTHYKKQDIFGWICD